MRRMRVSVEVLLCGCVLAVPALATDFPCKQLPLALEGASPAVLEPLVATVGGPAQFSSLVDQATGLYLGVLPQRFVPLQQVNVSKALLQAYKADPNLSFSPAEKNRQAASQACNAAYEKLLKTFSDTRKSIHYPDSVDDSQGLAEFVSWYVYPGTSQSDKDLAKAIVVAQRDYGKACLSGDIPPEMNADLVNRAVGILLAENQPICAALRQGDSTIVTAQHCFRNPDGTLYQNTVAAASGKLTFWFVYGAEPDNRYGICSGSIPKIDSQPFRAYADNISLRISKPSLPAANWKWASLPLKSGVSLYLRGYFHFAEENSDIARMRATAGGGCAAFGAKDRCVFHACQSTQIMSGAPVFIRPEPGQTQTILEVVGLHLGAASIASKTAASPGVCEGIDGSNFNLGNLSYQPMGY